MQATITHTHTHTHTHAHLPDKRNLQERSLRFSVARLFAQVMRNAVWFDKARGSSGIPPPFSRAERTKVGGLTYDMGLSLKVFAGTKLGPSCALGGPIALLVENGIWVQGPERVPPKPSFMWLGGHVGMGQTRGIPKFVVVLLVSLQPR